MNLIGKGVRLQERRASLKFRGNLEPQKTLGRSEKGAFDVHQVILHKVILHIVQVDISHLSKKQWLLLPYFLVAN